MISPGESFSWRQPYINSGRQSKGSDSLNCSDQRAVGPHEPLIGMAVILPCSSQTQNIAFKFDQNHKEFRHRSRDFEADSLQICSKTNQFGLLQATPPLEDPPPNLRQRHPRCNRSRSHLEPQYQRASSLCLCRESEGAGAGGGEAPFRGSIQGMWSRDVVKGGGGRDSLRRGPELIGCV